MTPVAIATEDELSEAIALKIISSLCPDFNVMRPFRDGGNGYLRREIHNFNEIAKQYTVLVITDLDTNSCPSKLIESWLGKAAFSQKLIFRVAVRQTESWLLADHEAMRKLLGPRGRLPPKPDQLANPKHALLSLAKKAPGNVRRDLVAERGSTASQGIGYNSRLVALVASHWDPARAETNSESLARACYRLRLLQES